MNAAKMTLVSTVVAAVLGLALSFGASPAEAHCKGKHADMDCDGVAEGRSQTFEVEIIDGSLVTDDCLGSTKRKQVTDAKFLPVTVDGCAGLTIPIIGGLHLCQINIIRPDRPNMALGVFFTTGVGVVGGALCPDADPEDVYQGEFDAQFDDLHPRCLAPNPDDATCVTIRDSVQFVLEKTTQPGKGSEVADDEFSIGTIVWTPCGAPGALC